MADSEKRKTRSEILDYLYSASISSAQCEIDIRQSTDRRIVYNLDYSSFFCGIWEKTKRRSLYDAVSGEFYSELVSTQTLPYTPIITSITFLELLETFLRKVEDQKSRAQDIFERVQRIHRNISLIKEQPESGNVRFPLRQLQIQHELEELDEITGRRLSQSISRAEQLIGKNGNVVGLGDILGASYSGFKFDQEKIDSLYNEMWSFRASRDTRNSIDEKEFRYLIDTINIYLTQELNRSSNSTEYNYVSKASYTSRFCPDHGRTPLVPVFWLKSLKNPEFLNNHERVSFFRMLRNEAEYAYERFFARADLPERDTLNYNLLERFTETYMSQLDIIRKDYEKLAPELQHDRLFTDRNFMRNEVEKNISSAEQAFERLYNDFGGIYSDDLIERGGVERLDHYKSIIRKIEKRRK